MTHNDEGTMIPLSWGRGIVFCSRLSHYLSATQLSGDICLHCVTLNPPISPFPLEVPHSLLEPHLFDFCRKKKHPACYIWKQPILCLSPSYPPYSRRALFSAHPPPGNPHPPFLPQSFPSTFHATAIPTSSFSNIISPCGPAGEGLLGRDFIYSGFSRV